MLDASPSLVIGLTGPIGSGASTVATILESQGFKRVSISGPIKAEFRKRYKLSAADEIKSVDRWREKLQDIGDEGRDESRGGERARWIKLALEGGPAGEVVIEGIRNSAEVQYMRDCFTKSFLVAVVADKPIRWERTRSEYGSNEDVFDRADKRDSEDKDDSPHGQQVEQCVSGSDYVLVNNDHLVPSDQRNRVLQKNLADPIEMMRGNKRQNPRAEEAHMAEAYALSHRSRCLKRHVGAVILDEDNLPVSSGFNENPVGMRPCELEFNNSCYKDNLMHEKLEAMVGIYCAACGKKTPQIKKPWKCPQCGDDLKRRFFPSRNMEYCTALHAEERAIRGLNGRRVVNGTMFVTTFPCLQCARYIVDAGITKVVFVEAYPVKEAREYLELNKVSVVPFSGFKARAFHIIYRQVG